MARAQLPLLDGIIDPDAKAAAVAEVGPDVFCTVSYYYYETIQASGPRPLDDVLQKGLSCYGKHDLGPVGGERPHPAPLTGGENDRLHCISGLIEVRESLKKLL
jgi:hypothetical protein